MTTPVFHSQSPYSNHKVRIPTTNCTGLPKVTWRDYPGKLLCGWNTDFVVGIRTLWLEYGGHFSRKVSLGHYDRPRIPTAKSVFQPRSLYSYRKPYRTQQVTRQAPWVDPTRPDPFC